MSDQTQGPDDPGLDNVLRHLGVPASALLGHGGEARVYAIDDERVVRVIHPGGSCDHIRERQTLVDELARAPMPFALPEVLDCGTVDGRSYAIERRLTGRSVTAELGRLDRRERDRLVEHHLDAARALGDLRLDDRGWYGDLLASTPVRADGWLDYLTAKAADGLERAPGFEAIDPARLAADLADLAASDQTGPTGDVEGSFVHLDAFGGNMLAVGSTVTAVIDIGASSIRGDRRLDPLSAAVYLCAPPITPEADDGDRRVAERWLADAGLLDHLEPARRWLAAFWAWASDDRVLHRWCRSVLLD